MPELHSGGYSSGGNNCCDHSVIVELFSRPNVNALSLALVVQCESGDRKELAKKTISFMAGITGNIDIVNKLDYAHSSEYTMGSIWSTEGNCIDLDRVRIAWKKGSLGTQSNITNILLRHPDERYREALWNDDFFWKNARRDVVFKNICAIIVSCCEHDLHRLLKSKLYENWLSKKSGQRRANYFPIPEYVGRALYNIPHIKADLANEQSAVTFLAQCPTGIMEWIFDIAQHNEVDGYAPTYVTLDKARYLQRLARITSDSVDYNELFQWIEVCLCSRKEQQRRLDSINKFDKKVASSLLMNVDIEHVTDIFYPGWYKPEMDRRSLGSHTSHLMSSMGAELVPMHKDKILELIFKSECNWFVQKWVNFIGWFNKSYRNDVLVSSAEKFCSGGRVKKDIMNALLGEDNGVFSVPIDDYSDSYNRGTSSSKPPSVLMSGAHVPVNQEAYSHLPESDRISTKPSRLGPRIKIS